MLKVTLRQSAVNDLSDIWEYTLKEWSISQADKYFQIIKSACNEIGLNPNIGKNYTEVSKNIFGLKTEKHR